MRRPLWRAQALALAALFTLMNVVPYVYALAPRDPWLQRFWLAGARAERRNEATLSGPLAWTFALPDLRTGNPRPSRGPLALLGHAERAGQAAPLPDNVPAWWSLALLFVPALVAVGRAWLPAPVRRHDGERDAPDPPPRALLPLLAA
jgi:hypothetical protein